MYACLKRRKKERQKDRQTVIMFGSVCNNGRNSGNSRQNDINRCKILDFGVCIEYNSLRSDVYNGLEDMTETATVLIVTTTAH